MEFTFNFTSPEPAVRTPLTFSQLAEDPELSLRAAVRQTQLLTIQAGAKEQIAELAAIHAHELLAGGGVVTHRAEVRVSIQNFGPGESNRIGWDCSVAIWIMRQLKEGLLGLGKVPAEIVNRLYHLFQ